MIGEWWHGIRLDGGSKRNIHNKIMELLFVCIKGW
jgi:hypothetical protein